MIKLRPWAEADRPLLDGLLANPAMTRFVGGPETAEQIQSRHERYLRLNRANNSKARSLAVVLDQSGEAIGWTGYWEIQWRGQAVYEMGWSILPFYQGRGCATAAGRLTVELARLENSLQEIYAFPSILNAPSNSICRKLGFNLVEECDVEYPPGKWMRANSWKGNLL